MKLNELGNSGVKVSEVSLGCWTMGGLNWSDGNPNGWADVDETEIREAIKLAIDAGVNHFDNADVYGNGRAERLLGKVIHDLGLDSKQFVIATKVGHFKGTANHAYEPHHIRAQCEQSLINLRRDYIDIFYFHHGDFGPNDVYLDDAVEAMNRLVEEGKVRLKGQSAYSPDDFVRLYPKVKPVVLQSLAHLVNPSFVAPGSAVNQLMQKNNLNFVAFAPLYQGVLLNKYRSGQEIQFEPGDFRTQAGHFQQDYLAKLEPVLARYTEKFGTTPKELAPVAIRYVLNHPRVACAIPGFRNARQVSASLATSAFELSAEEMQWLDECFQEVR